MALAALVLAALVAAGLGAGTAAAHDAGESDAHGDIRVATDPDECVVQVDASPVDHGSATLKVLNASGEGAPALLALRNVSGHPIPDGDPPTFSIEADIELTANEAAGADRVVMEFEGDNGTTHRAEAALTPFNCAVEAAAPPPCPAVTNVTAEAGEDGPKVRFTIHTVEGADAYRVHRATDGGESQLLEQVAPGGTRGDPSAAERITYVDEDVEPGTTYAYNVTAINAAGESADCGTHEVTTSEEGGAGDDPSGAEDELASVPSSGALAVAALAGAGSIVTYAARRRR